MPLIYLKDCAFEATRIIAITSTPDGCRVTITRPETQGFMLSSGSSAQVIETSETYETVRAAVEKATKSPRHQWSLRERFSNIVAPLESTPAQFSGVAVEDAPKTTLHDRVNNDFAYHVPPTDQAAADHDRVRTLCRGLAHRLIDIAPTGRELDLALDRLEEVMHWANSALAKRNPIAGSTAGK